MHRIFFDQYSGEVLGRVSPGRTLADQYIARVNNELHYGTIGGLFTKVPWFIACALVPFFAVTGILLWRRRSRKTRVAAASSQPNHTRNLP